MKKRLTSILLAAVLAMTMVVPAQAANTFTDVSSKYWAYDAIEEMAEKGIVSGVGNGKFNPNGYVTLAQFVSMLVRVFYADEIAADPASYDVWYEQVMHWALENGLLYQLNANGSYTKAGGREIWRAGYVNGVVDREEMAIIMYNFLKQNVALPSEETLRNKTAAAIPDLGNGDATVFDQFAIATVYELGCLSGMDSEGTFNGSALITRGQACVALFRMQKLVTANAGQAVGADWVKKLETGQIREVLKAPTDDGVVRYNGKTLVNGERATESTVADRINELRKKYPQGMSCTDGSFFYIDPVTGQKTPNTGCYALAMYIMDYVFGYGAFDAAKGTQMGKGCSAAQNDAVFSSIKPGDHIRIKDLPHSVIVLEVFDDYVTVVEGNYNKAVNWGGKYTKEYLSSHSTMVYTCY